ncbi:TIGR03767 family metallophosphoesterase [Actinoallomurus sp. NBC_01490]|uniref:TIGR03767 family metallophosphoesterase n=1 Tax=Actinoallomurus sp. NBC_01490 TaxID=2903557 RepID=UPI002E34D683|nr:TIGR03767 family metallophosphoesterase [Actinoallomurus sp. NBC_01490]
MEPPPYAPGTTTRTIRRAATARTGTVAPYRVLADGPGEPHTVRTDLVPERAPEPGGSVVLRAVHLTDLQIADLASPARVEFLQEREGTPGLRLMLPAYRPQEFLALHGAEAMIRTLRDPAAAGGPIDLVLTTGDNTDSAQANELRTWLDLLTGAAPIDPARGAGGLDATPAAVRGGAYWNPEPGPADVWKRERGFPDVPGLLAEAARPFRPAGLAVPWLACFGNHDTLVQGRAPTTPALERLVRGAAKPVAPPLGLPGGDLIDAYRLDPTVVSGGASRPVRPDPERRHVGVAEYVRAHLEAGGDPAGHGFTAANAADGTGYYVYDAVPGVRLICLDTTNPGGYADGSLGARQAAWLTDRLAEVHGPGADRAVVLFSHHGLSTLTNGVPPADPAERTAADLPRLLAPDVERLLHRFPNVVAWVSGHTHVNRVTPRPGPGGGFWEISTSSLAEWPVQGRRLELGTAGPGIVVLRSTSLDSAAPADPADGHGLWRLAALHREAAANEPGSVGGPAAHGTPADRNVDLLVGVPVALTDALTGAGRPWNGPYDATTAR